MQFRRKFGNYANPSFRKIVKKRTLETANLNKQNKHRSLILMKHRRVTPVSRGDVYVLTVKALMRTHV